MRLTVKRLAIIIDALAYWETLCDDYLMDFDGDVSPDDDLGTGFTKTEWNRRREACLQAHEWAHEQLAKRGTTISEVKM